MQETKQDGYSRERLRSMDQEMLNNHIKLINELWWSHNWGEVMASKKCPLHGYVDARWEHCVGCRGCEENK